LLLFADEPGGAKVMVNVPSHVSSYGAQLSAFRFGPRDCSRGYGWTSPRAAWTKQLYTAVPLRWSSAISAKTAGHGAGGAT